MALQADARAKMLGVVDLADVLKETGWFISDFQDAFKQLQEEDKVKNLDARGTRRKNMVHFEQGERLQKLEL